MSINTDEEGGYEFDVDDDDERKEIRPRPSKLETASLGVHVVLISLYVILWTSESLVIHSAKDTDYEKASVTVSIEIFKLGLSIFFFWYVNTGGKAKRINFWMQAEWGYHEGFLCLLRSWQAVFYAWPYLLPLQPS